jgi:hypothetical protein
MKNLINKFALHTVETTVNIAAGARILCVQSIFGTPHLIVSENPDSPIFIDRTFRVLQDGDEFETDNFKYVGTAVEGSGIIYHVLEVLTVDMKFIGLLNGKSVPLNDSEISEINQLLILAKIIPGNKPGFYGLSDIKEEMLAQHYEGRLSKYGVPDLTADERRAVIDRLTLVAFDKLAQRDPFLGELLQGLGVSGIFGGMSGILGSGPIRRSMADELRDVLGNDVQIIELGGSIVDRVYDKSEFTQQPGGKPVDGDTCPCDVCTERRATIGSHPEADTIKGKFAIDAGRGDADSGIKVDEAQDVEDGRLTPELEAEYADAVGAPVESEDVEVEVAETVPPSGGDDNIEINANPTL